jgi:hypothetical protein
MNEEGEENSCTHSKISKTKPHTYLFMSALLTRNG